MRKLGRDNRRCESRDTTSKDAKVRTRFSNVRKSGHDKQRCESWGAILEYAKVGATVLNMRIQGQTHTMDVAVTTLKNMFRQHIGATWAQAARANATSVLMTAAAIRRSKKPWEEYDRIARETGNDSTASYVRKHLQTYAFRHEWLA